jgi:hypothetical protein
MLRRLRQMAAGGALPSEILSFVRDRTDVSIRLSRPHAYLGRAFLTKGSFFLYTFSGFPFPPEREDSWRQAIEEKRAEWERQRLPELMRLRDYFSFMQFAKEQRAVVIVCGAHPAAGKWIGRPGVRCYGGRLAIPTRDAPPNDGLLAADPGDARLVEMLNSYGRPLSYSDFVRQLKQLGLQVLGPETGYVIADDLGNRFHESYRLHGVYDAQSKVPMWTQQRGERLRAALNRHLGAELARFGPHDNWQFRNDREIAGPFWGPQPPAIEFGPDQEIDNIVTIHDLWKKLRDWVNWGELYPHHPIEDTKGRAP